MELTSVVSIHRVWVGSLLRVAHGLQFVPIRIAHIGRVIRVAVMRTGAGCAVAGAPSYERRIMDLVNRVSAGGGKGDMRAVSDSCRAFVIGQVDKPFWVFIGQREVRRFVQAHKTQERHHRVIENRCAVNIVGAKSDVADDGHGGSFGGCTFKCSLPKRLGAFNAFGDCSNSLARNLVERRGIGQIKNRAKVPGFSCL